jgi:hypothetical protein
MNKDRYIFGKHKNGYIFPMILYIKPQRDTLKVIRFYNYNSFYII